MSTAIIAPSKRERETANSPRSCREIGLLVVCVRAKTALCFCVMAVVAGDIVLTGS